jgi:hypothetical protein
MEEVIRPFSTLFGNRTYLRSLCEGAVFLAASTIAIYAAVSYATVHASNPVTDLVLSRIGPFNVRFLFIYGTFTAVGFTLCLLVRRPNRLPFALKAMALFLLVRAVFVALTHIAPSPSTRSSRRRSSIRSSTAAICSFPDIPGCPSSRRSPSGTSCSGACSTWR